MTWIEESSQKKERHEILWDIFIQIFSKTEYNNDQFFAIFFPFYPSMDSYVGETHTWWHILDFFSCSSGVNTIFICTLNEVIIIIP